jgi:hypothetical protein
MIFGYTLEPLSLGTPESTAPTLPCPPFRLEVGGTFSDGFASAEDAMLGEDETTLQMRRRSSAAVFVAFETISR